MLNKDLFSKKKETAFQILFMFFYFIISLYVLKKMGMLEYIIFSFFLIMMILSLTNRYFLIIILLTTLASGIDLGDFFLPISIRIQELVVMFIAILYIKELLIFDWRKITSMKYIQALLIYLFVISIFIILHMYASPKHILSVLKEKLLALTLFPVIVLIIKKKDITFVVKVWLTVALLSAVLGIIQSTTGKFTFSPLIGERNYFALLTSGKIGQSRAGSGLFTWFNAFGMYIQFNIFLAMSLFFKQQSRRKKFLLFILILLLFWAEIISFSRGGYLTTYIGLIIFLYFFSKRGRIIALGLLALMAFFFIVYIIPNFALLKDQFITLIGRLILWTSGLKYLKLHPVAILSGIGPGEYEKVLGFSYTAHNVYLLHLVELGVFSFLALLYLVFQWLKTLYKLYKVEDNVFLKSLYQGLFVSFVVYFIHDFIEHTFFSVVFLMINIFWMAIVYILNRDIRKL